MIKDTSATTDEEHINRLETAWLGFVNARTDAIKDGLNVDLLLGLEEEYVDLTVTAIRVIRRKIIK